MNKRSQPSSLPKYPPFSYATFLLGRREYSAHELRKKMLLKGYELAAIDEVLIRLAADGYQSDARYAASQARQRSVRSGNRVVRQYLRQGGVDEEEATRALLALPDEIERLRALARRFEGRLDDEKLRTKAINFLLRRGFSWSDVRRVLDEMKEEEMSS